MAISLLFGVLVSTLLTLIVIPLGCISIGPKVMCASASPAGAPLHAEVRHAQEEYRVPLWLRIWSGLINVIIFIVNIATMLFYIVRAVLIIIGSILSGIWQRFFPEKPHAIAKPIPPSSSPPAPPVVEPPPPPVAQPAAPKVTEVKSTPQPAETTEVRAESNVEEEDGTEVVENEESQPTDIADNSARPRRKRMSSQRRGIRLKSDLPKSDPKETDKPSDSGDDKGNT
jgi:hypothetical protein